MPRNNQLQGNHQLGIYRPYQVGAPPGARYQRLGAAGALVQAVRNGALNEVGNQLVRGASNARESLQRYYGDLGVQDRMRQSYRRDQEVPDEDFPYDGEDSAMVNAGNGNNMGVSANGPSGSGSNTGFRGPLIGRGQTNDNYERYYHEGALFHSKATVTNLSVYGLSRWQTVRPDFWGQTNPLPLFPFPGVFADGLVYTIVDNGGQAISDDRGIFYPWCHSTDFKEFNIGEWVYTVPINLSSNMLLNSKLSGSSTNSFRSLLSQYSKFRLHSFTIEVQFESYPLTPEESYPGWFQSICKQANWLAGNDIGDYNTTMIAQRKVTRCENPIKYMVYRDCDYLFSDGSGFIPLAPPDSKNDATKADMPNRVVWSLLEVDKNISIISDHEKYSYTRKINPQGNYFLTRESVQALFKASRMSLDKFVAALEGANSTDTIVKPLVEGFNLLYAPINSHVRWYGPFKFSQSQAGFPKEGIWIPLVQTSTKVTLTVRAEWEAWNYDYNSLGVLPTSFTTEYQEPLEMLETNYKFEKAVNAMKN